MSPCQCNFTRPPSARLVSTLHPSGRRPRLAWISAPSDLAQGMADNAEPRRSRGRARVPSRHAVTAHKLLLKDGLYLDL